MARWLGRTFCPALWQRMVLWKSARAERRFWKARAILVQSCPDNGRLSRVADAGSVGDGLQVMHNGIRVLADSYYGRDGTSLITANRGCHEPQEEVVFDAIVKAIPSGGTMMELGAYWGFYSLWFAKEVSDSRVHLVEPESLNLEMGKKNFQINGCHGQFTQAYIGSADGMAPDGIRITCVNTLMAENGLEHLHVLHSDIQGFELEMLHGASALLKSRRIDYLFVSTHSDDLHQKCEDFLVNSGYQILASVNLKESYSVDGILVASSPLVVPPLFDPPAKRSASIT
ncbi:FkbM family methyltransferase [Prosthecobacter sp.]|uniref:FkbM family methyltransferase n=1 Tax=Prosthecobacter sp. TaxID=1965333 RepID=UPI003784DC93